MTTSILATWEEPSSTSAADSVTLLSNLNGQFLSISSIGVQQTSSLFLVYQSVTYSDIKKNKLKKKKLEKIYECEQAISAKNPTTKWLAFRNIKLWVHDIPNSSSTLFAFPLSGCLPFFSHHITLQQQPPPPVILPSSSHNEPPRFTPLLSACTTPLSPLKVRLITAGSDAEQRASLTCCLCSRANSPGCHCQPLLARTHMAP